MLFKDTKLFNEYTCKGTYFVQWGDKYSGF